MGQPEWPVSHRRSGRRAEADGMAMKYTVYVLISKELSKTYVGQTDNFERRLKEHNDGKSLFSRRYKPWSLFYKEEIESLIAATNREKYLKSAAGRRWVKRNLFKELA